MVDAKITACQSVKIDSSSKIDSKSYCNALSCVRYLYSIITSCAEPAGQPGLIKPEDHWSCIDHPSAGDMLKSAVTEGKKITNIESE